MSLYCNLLSLAKNSAELFLSYELEIRLPLGLKKLARKLGIFGRLFKWYVGGGEVNEPVSYTHLTLPTIYSV